MTAPVGVLVMAYGTASGPDDIERYYADIRGGRGPSPQHLAELKKRYAAIGPDRAIQGNLDPAALLGPWDVVERKARDVLARAADRDGHVFNLGHGVLPDTPVEHLERLVDLVHEGTERRVS